MTAPADGYEPLTPVQAERQLRGLITELTKAQQSLAKARSVEAEAKLVLEAANLRAWYSDDCPVPTRGGPTVADRDRHVERATVNERFTYHVAVKDREIAVDYLRTLYTQASLAQTLTSSVGKAFDVAGAR